MKRFVFVICMIFALGVQAQDTGTQTTTSAEEVKPEEPVNAQANKSDRVEKLEVTGSHIKRIDVEGPSPILTLDREYIDKSGYNNLGDVLRDTTVASFGGSRENSLTSGAGTGASTTSLRGFGADRILILLDGKRLPGLGGSSQVDLALIPMSAVERIEVLKDGASATYGSDALGGVINIITKKDYDGAAVELGYMAPMDPGGNRTDVKVSYGKTWSRGSILGVAQYRNNEATKSRDFAFARPQPDWYSQSGSPGTWVDPTNGAQPGSPADPCPADRTRVDGFCTFDYSPYSYITPQIDQYSALLAGTFNISEELKAYGRAIYTRREVNGKLAPSPDSFRDDSPTGTNTGGPNYQIDQTTATNNWGLPGVTGDLNLVRYRLVEEGGSRISKVNSDSFAVQTGVQGYFFDSWEWEVSGTYGASDTTNTGVSGYYNKGILFDMAVNNTHGGFNPFAAPGSKSNIAVAKYNPVDTVKSSMGTVNMIATGELLDMPAGPLSLAVGVSNAWQSYEQKSDPITSAGSQWGGSVILNGSGRRDFQSAYTEFAIPPFTGMEIQVAGRFDNYSDFGSTVNPKIGFMYKPLNMLSVRGTVGTGYRAPSLEDLYDAQTIDYPSGEDPITGQKAQFETTKGGNRNLKEETTVSANLGVVAQLFKDLSIVVDYWKTEQENEVSQTEIRDIFRAEQTLGNPYLQQFGINVVRNNGTNLVERIVAPKVNAASVDVSGLDMSIGYNFSLYQDIKFYTSVTHSLMFEYLVEPFPGLGKENRVGYSTEAAMIPYWKNNILLGAGNNTYDLSFLIRTIGETNASAFSPDPGAGGKTRDHTEIDLRIRYSAPWDGTFTFMIKNVLDTDRPLVDEYLTNTGYLHTSTYDPFGRAVGLTYRQEF